MLDVDGDWKDVSVENRIANLLAKKKSEACLEVNDPRVLDLGGGSGCWMWSSHLAVCSLLDISSSRQAAFPASSQISILFVPTGPSPFHT